MQIGTQNVPFWEFACGELGTTAPALEIESVEGSPLVEAMPLGGVIQAQNGARAVDGCGKCGTPARADPNGKTRSIMRKINAHRITALLRG